mmetsp:Transcript_126607/g.248217  ORF Transcript_126607/g.248217 Transcript_126607/m.248217 type:complete len:251 (+) Transcript_126607:489-1241(+)
MLDLALALLVKLVEQLLQPVAEVGRFVGAELLLVAERRLLVQVRLVGVLLALRDQRRGKLAAGDLAEEVAVDALFEELLRLNLVPTVPGPEPLLDGLGQKALDEFLAGVVVVLRWDHQGALDDGEQNAGHILGRSAEGHVAGHQLEEHHAQRPHVALDPVALAADHLRSHVVRRARDRESPRLALGQALRQAEVDQLDVALRVEHHVLRFQVPVDDGSLVQALEDKGQGANVELRVPPGQDAHLLEHLLV